MARPRKASSPAVLSKDYDAFAGSIRELLESARRVSARTTNAIMTATYWEIGRRIVEFQQGGRARAEYGEEVLPRLSKDLLRRYGRGFSVDRLERMRAFFLTYQSAGISATLSRKSPPTEKGHPTTVLRGAAIAKYALEGLPNKVLAAEYRMILPDEKDLAAELTRTRKLLESRRRA